MCFVCWVRAECDEMKNSTACIHHYCSWLESTEECVGKTKIFFCSVGKRKNFLITNLPVFEKQFYAVISYSENLAWFFLPN